jgi:hypothetical protein
LAALAAIALVGGIYLVYLFTTHRFADKHPDLAALGDSEWLAWAQGQIAAKNMPVIPTTPGIIDPVVEIVSEASAKSDA